MHQSMSQTGGNEKDGYSQQSARSSSGAELSDSSSEPQNYRSLINIYNTTDKISLPDEELMYIGADEPANYKQAVNDREWKTAMKREIESIEQNKTWKLTEAPQGSKIIGLKWIYKIKRDASSKVVRHKARLVAKGYTQEYGIDFEEIFAPETCLETVRLLLAFSAKHNWKVHHLHF